MLFLSPFMKDALFFGFIHILISVRAYDTKKTYFCY